MKKKKQYIFDPILSTNNYRSDQLVPAKLFEIIIYSCVFNCFQQVLLIQNLLMQKYKIYWFWKAFNKVCYGVLCCSDDVIRLYLTDLRDRCQFVTYGSRLFKEYFNCSEVPQVISLFINDIKTAVTNSSFRRCKSMI